MDKTEFLVFYSWQSDIPETRYLILDALTSGAKAAMVSRPDFNIVVDQATRDLPGAPNIPFAIMAKIREADMMVADITTINSDAPARRSPNPNVVFELGFAVALLGWERMTLLFDGSVGKFPDDMPFDFDRHRASNISTAAAAKHAGEAKRLSKLVQTAIETIIDKNPARPTASMTPEQTRHHHDVGQLMWLFSNIHIPTVDGFIEGMPHRLSDKAIHLWEGVNGILSGRMFHLHDLELFDSIRKFWTAFGKALSYDQMYHQASSPLIHIFAGHDNMATAEQQRAWDAIEEARDQMQIAFEAMLARVRGHYLEVDLEDTNRLAWEDYLKHQSDWDGDGR